MKPVHQLQLAIPLLISAGSLVNFLITVYMDDPAITPAKPHHCYQHVGSIKRGSTITVHCERAVKGRYLRITNNGGSKDVACTDLFLCDVKVTPVVKRRKDCVPHCLSH